MKTVPKLDQNKKSCGTILWTCWRGMVVSELIALVRTLVAMAQKKCAGTVFSALENKVGGQGVVGLVARPTGSGEDIARDQGDAFCKGWQMPVIRCGPLIPQSMTPYRSRPF
jgi:hypothetical protein